MGAMETIKKQAFEAGIHVKTCEYNHGHLDCMRTFFSGVEFLHLIQC